MSKYNQQVFISDSSTSSDEIAPSLTNSYFGNINSSSGSGYFSG